ncbi:ribonuclease P protein subunit-like protein [Hapsidospora chrysogenum ATCC 11550]|uniref:Ribonuclease P protein subunit-like protein n=1 Tax=Hapsidospora chrysogenum (strain ATCC 11550 / CBS 779.69 / DSM 880 / IAM 14645 / JCM 23072 / IMI 49137) TaxID=857340 RepID=A0A086TAR6_HAPC1|nr:ribonuclease P protein subunit-like protein [Hapsidospora chrysogenum ATCC 11550]
MLYDLNIAWSPSTTKDQLLQTLALASTLGYGTVALNHALNQPPQGNATAPFPDLSSTTTTSTSSKKLPHILHRATIPLSDPAASNYRLPALARTYDIIAVRPLTPDAFQNACITLDVPLISLDLTQHFPFHFRPKPCMAAVARGVRFEICYAQCLAADARGRATFISNTANLIRATRGRGIVISSEARGVLALRAPADVVNLLSVWGLGNEKGMESLGPVPRSVVVNEGIKRNGFRGVIDIVKPAEPGPGDLQPSKQAEGSGQDSKKNKKQKRKNGDEENQPGNKRQHKKMKVVTREPGPTKA